MKDSNPYTPTQTPAGPANQKAGGRGFEVFHNTFRGLFAFSFIGLGPIFVVPRIKTIFEEFGIDLPLIAQLILQFSDLACSAAIIFLPLSLGVFAATEFGIISIPSGTLKTLVNIIYWLALILVIGLACVALAMPLSII